MKLRKPLETSPFSAEKNLKIVLLPDVNPKKDYQAKQLNSVIQCVGNEQGVTDAQDNRVHDGPYKPIKNSIPGQGLPMQFITSPTAK